MSLRPKTFDEFIGQDHVKRQLKIAIDSARSRSDVIDHVLLSGPAGTGKTTVANVIANGLGTRCVETIANVLKTPADIITTLVQLRRGDVLFIDEIHALPVTVQEYLYTAMEDYKVNAIAGAHRRAATIQLHKFVLVGATTIEGYLTGPLLSRFGIVCAFTAYKTDDMIEIVDRAAKADGITIDEDAKVIIADRSRATPRIALRQLRRIRDSAVLKGTPNRITSAAAFEAYEILGITYFGFTHQDCRVLKALAKAQYAMGIEVLSSMTNVDKHTIETVIEPHLLRLGFVARTPRGRRITDEGKNVAEQLKL